MEDKEQSRLHEGKDEMNLAEFPLCAISDRLNPNQESLVFEDRVWDKSRGATITRQLLITGAKEYGLPTAHDDEVLLGLIQLSKLQGFASRRVPFTRYQLIRLLGWRDETKSYERIEKSLNRWIGVTLYYQNAWRDREHQSWVDEKFHLLDNVTLLDREKIALHREAQTELPITSFTWNEVVFRSFQVGNLKSLDFDFFKQLEGAVAKRLYRFLDKRFFHRPRWEFNLQELCWEHVGLARSYDSSNLKRKLRPAISELEGKRFLVEVPDSERFRRLATGEWCVVFERARKESSKPEKLNSPNELLGQALVDRGVRPSAAADIVRRFPAERIQHQIEVFDWLMSQKDARVQRNPAGFLVSAIRGEYAAPTEFKTRQERADATERALEAKRKREERQAKEQLRADRKLQARREAAENFWNSFSNEERHQLQEEALRQAGAFEKTLLEHPGPVGVATRQKLLEEFALRSLEAAG